MKYRLLFIQLLAVYVFNLIDYYSTLYFVTAGLAVEGNPIMAWVMELELFTFIKLIVIPVLLVFIYCSCPYWNRLRYVICIGLWVMVISYGLVTLYHAVIGIHVVLGR